MLPSRSMPIAFVMRRYRDCLCLLYRENEPLLLAVRQPAEESPGLSIAVERFREKSGEPCPRGSVPTSTSPPAATPALSRFSALIWSMNCPPNRASSRCWRSKGRPAKAPRSRHGRRATPPDRARDGQHEEGDVCHPIFPLPSIAATSLPCSRAAS